MHTYIQTNIQSKRTTDNRTWQAVNAPEARINYNFRFCWHSPRQIRQAKPIDWWIEPMTDGLTAWMTDVCVEFGLKVTYWWPHKRKVRNCQLGNRWKRETHGRIRGAFGMTLKPPSQVSFLWYIYCILYIHSNIYIYEYLQKVLCVLLRVWYPGDKVFFIC